MQHKWPSLVLCLLSCFTGGVFLGTCFLHLMPDVAAGLAKVRRQFDWDVHYPVAEMISCVGFFLVFFVEELVLLCFNGRNGHHHHHGHNHEIFNNDSLDRRDSDDTHVCVTDCHHHHDHNPNNHNIHKNGENKILVKKKMLKNDSGSCPVE
uniref:Uncharacterized protein n=1 Tax=Romanomermis culicivorax TaxID=13658 RepID=A0A915JHG4_ROMCU